MDALEERFLAPAMDAYTARGETVLMPTLDEIARYLGDLWRVERYGADQNGVYAPAPRPVGRIGLVLEAWPGIGRWAAEERVDALWVHRPWTLPLERLGGIGVLAHHLAFDEHLTAGCNPRLADALGMMEIEPLGERDGRPLGMLGAVRGQDFAALARASAEVFGGHEGTIPASRVEISRVAVVGAMTDALVREAAARGAGAYVTGQLRRPADAAVRETGTGVIAVGHRRCEEWACARSPASCAGAGPGWSASSATSRTAPRWRISVPHERGDGRPRCLQPWAGD